MARTKQTAPKAARTAKMQGPHRSTVMDRIPGKSQSRSHGSAARIAFEQARNEIAVSPWKPEANAALTKAEAEAEAAAAAEAEAEAAAAAEAEAAAVDPVEPPAAAEELPASQKFEVAVHLDGEGVVATCRTMIEPEAGTVLVESDNGKTYVVDEVFEGPYDHDASQNTSAVQVFATELVPKYGYRGKPTYSGGIPVDRYITVYVGGEMYIGDRTTANFQGLGANGSTFDTFVMSAYKWDHLCNSNPAQPLKNGDPRPSMRISVAPDKSWTLAEEL